MGNKTEIKFSVGYQLREDKLFKDIVERYKEKIEEVYFSWLNLPSGRGPIAEKVGYINWEGQKQLEYELNCIKKMGIKLGLLLNASCYGGFNLSVSLANTVVSTIEYLQENIGIDIVTVFSPVVAYIIKKNFPGIKIRGSVNLRIGTVEGMEYVSDLFDSFVMQREYNRDFETIEELNQWCNKNGKTLCILVNSGCMNFCAVQLFHDNTISHEIDVYTRGNITEEIPGNCWSYYKKRENWRKLLQNSSWIRPEDIHNYKEKFSHFKLATRINQEPEKIIKAYCNEKFDGNLLDLFEPSHTKLLFPYIIENTKFPEDWFQKISSCKRNCDKCSYCKNILENILVKF
ncbi:MAG TPA: U32 family peptidase [bacterium]|nr:U32 family peptidase [bacterium]